MKRIIICVLAGAILPLFCFSQEKVLDHASLKCMYHHTYMNDTLEQTVREDLLVLQVGKNISKSYSYYTYQNDSLSKTPDGEKKWKEMFNQSLRNFQIHRNRAQFLNSFPRKRSTTYVYKNYPSGQVTVTDAVGRDHVLYSDTLNAQNWTITDSIKTILDYSCQMATCHFRGRDWTAWFTADIPVSDGPWKFGGLPGLIMDVSDRGKQYAFTIIGIENMKQEPILFTSPMEINTSYKEIDRKEFLKAYMRSLVNTSGFMEAETGVSFGKDKPVYYDLIERDYK
ncbi:MAG TPA: hypothetical protein DEG28_14665 [Porphyromonadaceae bacterium]|nr:hypothetical protein [Porphyromonadaceae bacterium]